jgi:hypothetical protein
VSIALSLSPTGHVMADEPTSETVRIPSDLVEMARFMAFHSKEVSGKRQRLSQVVESVLRAPLSRAYDDFKAALEAAQQSKGKKGGAKP